MDHEGRRVPHADPQDLLAPLRRGNRRRTQACNSDEHQEDHMQTESHAHLHGMDGICPDHPILTEISTPFKPESPRPLRWSGLKASDKLTPRFDLG